MNKTTKIIGIVILLIAGLFFLTGCGTDSTTPEPQPTVTVTEDSSNNDNWSDSVTVEDEFLDIVYTNGNSVIYASSDTSLIDAGWAYCDFLDSGFSAYEAFEVLIETAVTNEDAEAYGVIVGAAVVTLCPEHYEETANALQ